MSDHCASHRFLNNFYEMSCQKKNRLNDDDVKSDFTENNFPQISSEGGREFIQIHMETRKWAVALFVFNFPLFSPILMVTHKDEEWQDFE